MIKNEPDEDLVSTKITSADDGDDGEILWGFDTCG
jgi:hypothetical protein